MEIELLFVDFRGSSHVVLEWLCFPRDDIAPGSVLRILSRVDLHVVSRLLLYHLLSFFLFTCSLFHFLWALRTCQVGHFDSHIFWFLIEFFIENLVLTGGRYISFWVFRPKWSSKGVFCSSEWVVNLSTCSALSRLFLRLVPSSKLAFSRFFMDWMVLSANPVPVCRFAVPYLRIILFSLQYFLNSFDMKALPLSVLIDFGTP